MYCPECGTRLEEGELFCPECGTKVLPESSAPSSSSIQPTTATGVPDAGVHPHEETCDTPVAVKGLILTNIQTLSQRLHVPAQGLREMIEAYIQAIRQLGAQYMLLDASDYTYRKTNVLGIRKHVSLDSRSPWYDYAGILKDYHDAEVREGQKEAEYLFIIGGETDVPMPRVRHYLSNGHDKDFDTDLLYAYPYGQEMENKLLQQELFKYDALFYVGRLPIATDGSIEDLAGYLQRVLDNGCSVPIQTAYAQCDPNWQNITLRIVEELNEEKLFPDCIANLPREAAANRQVLLSPAIVCDEAKETHGFFNPYANYYFFNMHGSDARTAKGFFGQSLQQDYCVCGMSPTLIRSAQQPNMFFTQACYGGRFIGYRKHESMLLSALSAQTLSYVGSSRIAYGSADQPGKVSLSTSDVLAKVYNMCILAGCTAGQALFQARIATFKHHPGEPTHALTIGEFNLYGDPLIHRRSESQATHYTGDKGAILPPDAQVAPVQTEVLMNKSAGEQSLLERVRQSVDKNILDISARIAKSLYAQYGIEAREPSIVSRHTYADGHKELNFTYERPIENGLYNDLQVQTDEQGEIQQVNTTK